MTEDRLEEPHASVSFSEGPHVGNVPSPGMAVNRTSRSPQKCVGLLRYRWLCIRQDGEQFLAGLGWLVEVPVDSEPLAAPESSQEHICGSSPTR